MSVVASSTFDHAIYEAVFASDAVDAFIAYDALAIVPSKYEAVVA